MSGTCDAGGIEVIGAGLGRTGTKSLQAALDLLGYKTDTIIDGVEVAGAATYLENAVDCDINLYI